MQMQKNETADAERESDAARCWIEHGAGGAHGGGPAHPRGPVRDLEERPRERAYDPRDRYVSANFERLVLGSIEADFSK